MMATATPAVALRAEAVARFRTIVLARLGLEFPDRQSNMLAELLKHRLAWHRLDAENYLNSLQSDLLAGEFEALAPELTTPETYFFRNIEQFNALRERVLPALLQARRYTRSLRILSAGCATGEELYTLAMVMQDLTPGPDWDITLLGIDLNPEVLRKARAAHYTSWSLRETPEAARLRWFQPAGDGFVLQPALREAVRFELINLNEAAPNFWHPGAFDLIFARNVLMYLGRTALQGALARMTQSLAPDGYLFLGHSESLRELTEAYTLCHTHGTFYYRRRSTDEPAAMQVPTTAPVTTTAVAAPAKPDAADTIEAALTLFEQERFEDAAAQLTALDADAQRQPDAQVLQAMLRLHEGRHALAEDLAHELLTRDARHAAAHYVIALCRESTGNLAAARIRYEQAGKLDESFALPHLHLARLARERGDASAHRHELARTLALLEHESPQRLRLFGGGFDRIALQNMCRTELRRAIEGKRP